MPIDFSAAVLAPCMATFARAATIDPIRSQPGAEPYLAQGVYTSTTTTVQMADGAAFTDVITTLGIRAGAENVDGSPMYVKLPERGDRVTILDTNLQPLADGDFWVANRSPDGQGGHTLTLRKEMLP